MENRPRRHDVYLRVFIYSKDRNFGEMGEMPGGGC
jgi:hypothetical protein